MLHLEDAIVDLIGRYGVVGTECFQPCGVLLNGFFAACRFINSVGHALLQLID